MPTRLTLRRLFWDDDLIELGCDVDAGAFRGEATGYFATGDLPEFATGIERFLEHLEGRVSFRSVDEFNKRLVSLELYTVNLMRHTVIQVGLAAKAHRYEGPSSLLEVELIVEPAALQRFALDLRRLPARGEQIFLRTGTVADSW